MEYEGHLGRVNINKDTMVRGEEDVFAPQWRAQFSWNVGHRAETQVEFKGWELGLGHYVELQ